MGDVGYVHLLGYLKKQRFLGYALEIYVCLYISMIIYLFCLLCFAGGFCFGERVCCFVETGSHAVAHADLELVANLLTEPSEY